MIKNLIFSGGGLKGWAYIGTLRALSELIDRKGIEGVVGCSIGSVFGLFYLLDIKWDYILDYVMELNFADIIDPDIDSFIINQSILQGKIFKEIIMELISQKIDPCITFNDLWKYSKKLFTVTALNITDLKLEYFNWKLTPGIKVIDAIMASSSLPLLFPSYRIGNSMYYDGGVCNNCPVTFVNSLGCVAFIFGEPDTSFDNGNLFKLFNCLVLLLNKSNDSDEYLKFTILDPQFKNEMVNLNQSRDDIFNIYMNGYTNSKKVLFDNFIALKG